MDKFNFVQSAQPYYFNCTICGVPLFKAGDIKATEEMRVKGVCLDCLHEIKRALETQKVTLFDKLPWAHAHLN
jgi:hypothetical protein